MPVYVAFLRGMNVGGRRVKNDELCSCFEAMGFEQVSGFLASGNILFQSGRKSVAKLEPQIEQGLEDQLRYPVPTFVRSTAEVAGIAAKQPFSDAALAASTGNLQVALLSARPTASNRTDALALATPADLLALEGREMYWLPSGTISDSELNLKTLAKILGPMTVRTQRTMVRVAAKLD
jgi:uncharacterized protein (DUF1697 family)